MTEADLNTLLDGRAENEHIEFKEAKNNLHFEKLVDYCVALANAGGGRIVLGVSDQRPRKVVGTLAFELPEKLLQAAMNGFTSKFSGRRSPMQMVVCWYLKCPRAQWGTPCSTTGAT